MNTTPVSLLARLRDPQPESWRRFIDLYTPLLYFWAKRLGLQDADAADLVQDVLVKLVRKLPGFTYDGSRSFRGWLHAVLLNHWRSQPRRATVELPEIAAADPADALGEAEYHQYLAQRALKLMRSQFQPATWQACWRSVVDGVPVAEVAAELAMSEAAVYIARSRVLRRLRQELEGLLE